MIKDEKIAYVLNAIALLFAVIALFIALSSTLGSSHSPSCYDVTTADIH